MKIRKVEVVERYCVEFTPSETRTLCTDPWWGHRLSTRHGENNGQHPNDRWGKATLTKSEISKACDLLGVNAREFFAAQSELLAKLRGEP